MNKVKDFLIISLKYVIICGIIIVLFLTAKDKYSAWKNKDSEPVRYDEDYSQNIKESEYIISEDVILSNLQMKSEIVSFEQKINKTEWLIDKKMTGKRKTQINVSGSYKMGLNTEDILVSHIDSDNRIVYINLPEPILISLELPFEQIEFNKVKGFFRRSMKKDEEKRFFSLLKKEIINELTTDSDIILQAGLYNEQAVKSIILSTTDIRDVIFN